MSKKIVGILGGMGPLSTIELMKKVLEKTPAEKEQDHIRMLVDNRPEIPDRTEFILGKGLSPVPMLQESAQQLEKLGAELLAIPCNSAHVFIKPIQVAINIPVLDMINLVRIELEKHLSPGASIGLLATTGTLKTNLYHQYLKEHTLMIPDEKTQQELVMEAIYGKNGIKARGNTPENQKKLMEAIDSLVEQQPKAIIAGCTEVELALEGIELQVPIFYPLDILANEILLQALK
jgi:aspartate racemase